MYYSENIKKTITGWSAALVLLSAFEYTAYAVPRPVASNTGLVSLRSGKAVRVRLVEVDRDRKPQKAQLLVLDGQSEVIKEVSGAISSKEALSLQLRGDEINARRTTFDDVVSVRFEFRIFCEALDKGPIMSVELYDLSTGAIEYVETCYNSCGTNTSEIGARGINMRPTVIPSCPSRNIDVLIYQ
ncbi:MAG: hypothetical protein KTR25_00340 [Myxococcales bacterium]|nr:hypothetical protein [Myxococcales bacterium]